MRGPKCLKQQHMFFSSRSGIIITNKFYPFVGYSLKNVSLIILMKKKKIFWGFPQIDEASSRKVKLILKKHPR